MSPAETTPNETASPEQVQAHTHHHRHAHDHDHDHAAEKPLGACEREVECEIPADVVETEREKLLGRYTKMARIPGFRPGKAPKSLIRSRFQNELNQELLETVLPRFFREKVEAQKLIPVSQPRITDLHADEGEPLKFKARFEVMPEIKLGDYADIKAEKGDTSVADEEVEREIQQMREQMSSYEPVAIERPIQDGDFVQVSLTGEPKKEANTLVDASGKPLSSEEGEKQEEAKPVHMEAVMVQIGGENTVKEFSENLRGANVGDTKTFDVAYKDDFADKRLAGKTFSYTAQIKAIKKKVVPELDDAFAKELGDFTSVDEMRAKLRERLEDQKKHDVEHKGKDKIVEELVNRNDFPLPESLIEHQINTRLERGLRALASQGMREEQMRKLDFSRLREGQRESAVREVKASLILEKIADQENVQVSDEDLEREVQMIALQSKQPMNDVRERLTRDGTLDRIRERLRNEKTLDLLYQRSA